MGCGVGEPYSSHQNSEKKATQGEYGFFQLNQNAAHTITDYEC